MNRGAASTATDQNAACLRETQWHNAFGGMTIRSDDMLVIVLTNPADMSASKALRFSERTHAMQRAEYREPMLVRTKIIATVGPACGEKDQLRDLILSGVDVFRLNFAHGKHEWLDGIVKSVRELSQELGRSIGLLGDLSGPKIRLGRLPDNAVVCNAGAEFSFVRDRVPQTPSELTCTYESLIDDVAVGDRILLADGTVSFRVIECSTTDGFARCVVEGAGTIRSRQGVNLPGVRLSTPSLTDKDRDDLAWAIKAGLDFVGFSFVRSADDVRLLRSVIEESGTRTPPMIVAKIEKQEAVDQIEDIVAVTDAIMVARGDLGVEADIVQVPGIQKRIIRMCNRKRVPVITATQMLDSMQSNELPTRAEASDVANAVLDGTDAVMLSGETAAGKYPRQSVAMMSRIVCEAEKLLPKRSERRADDDRSASESQALAVTEAMAVGAVAVAERLNADLIAVATVSGRSPRAISKERSGVPVLAICDNDAAARRLSLVWGITPIVCGESHPSADDLASLASDWGVQEGVLSAGSEVVVMAPSQWSDRRHDSLLVHFVEAE